MFKLLLDTRHVAERNRESERRKLLAILGHSAQDYNSSDVETPQSSERSDSATGLPAEFGLRNNLAT